MVPSRKVNAQSRKILEIFRELFTRKILQKLAKSVLWAKPYEWVCARMQHEKAKKQATKELCKELAKEEPIKTNSQ